MQKVKRILIGVAGVTVLVIGIALLVLPGPAFLVIPAGLAILAIEFAWARRWLTSAKNFLKGSRKVGNHGNKYNGRLKKSPPVCSSPTTDSKSRTVLCRQIKTENTFPQLSELRSDEQEALSRFEGEGGRAIVNQPHIPMDFKS